MLGINLNGVDSGGGYPMIEAGGYVIRITKAVNNTSKFRMEFEFDIAEGDFKDHYAGFKERYGWNKATFNKYYTEKAITFFKEFIETVEDSNGGAPGLVVQVKDENGEPQEDIDETKFVGLQLGMVFGLEEYYSEKKGKVYTREDFYGAEFVTVEDIHSGNYAVPEMKLLDKRPNTEASGVVDTTAGFEPVQDDDVPF